MNYLVILVAKTIKLDYLVILVAKSIETPSIKKQSVVISLVKFYNKFY